MNSHQRRKQRRIAAQKGYGPRHAFNAQEGAEEVPQPDEFGPGWQLKRALHSAGQKIPAGLKAVAKEVQSGILPDESIEEIRKNPLSLDSAAAYANAAIMLSRGAGGKGAGELPKGLVPGRVWESWKEVLPTKTDRKGKITGGIRVDPAGNHYQYEGSHMVGGEKLDLPYEDRYHAIVKPVEAPGGTLEHLRETQNLPDEQFPSLNKPPYDALKEPGSVDFDPALDPMEAQDAGAEPDGYGFFIKPKKPDLELPPPLKGEPKKSPNEFEIQEYLKQNPDIKDMGDLLDKWEAGFKATGGKLPLKDFGEFLQDNPPSYKPPKEPPQFEPRNPEDPFDRMPGSQGFPEFKKGSKGVKAPRKFRQYPPVRKVGAAKGFGPRHAENAKEGEDLTAVNTDTVPAMLTPREAVLNRNAAELAGRDKIEALNEEGNALAKKGVDLAGGKAERGKQKVEGLQGGSDDLPWEPPGALPSPTPPTNVYNNWPPGWTSPPSSTPPPSTIQENPFVANQMQLINNLGWDPSKPTYGFGSGEPTRRGFDYGGNIIGNATGIPGLGWGLGKLGRGLWHLYQNWQMHNADRRDQGDGTTAPATDASDDTAGAPQYSASDGGAGRGDKWHDIFGPRSSASGTPGVGVGIGPSGAPAVGREWWSPDFGRYDLGAQGTGAGNYNLQGPGGWAIGSRGTGFGNQTVGNFYTAIGLDRLGAGSGASNLNFTAGAWGDDARPHFNPYFGGYSQSGLTSGRGVALRAKGDSDVEKESMKTKQSKPKPQSGSPYAQGYEKLQGGGMAGMGGGGRGTPYGWQQHQENLATPGWQPPGHIVGGIVGTGGPYPTQVPGGSPYGYNPTSGLPNVPPGGWNASNSGTPASPNVEPPQGMPYGWKQHQRNLGNTTIPGLGGAGGGGFYPSGQGLAGGTESVLPVGAANPEHAYGDPIQLTAGDLGKFQQAAKAAGLSEGQIAGLTKMFASYGGGGGMASYGEGSQVSNALGPALEGAFSGGYQGGISDIGYPPMIAPNAEWHRDGGGWRGPYDPDFMFPAYAGGSSDIGQPRFPLPWRR